MTMRDGDGMTEDTSAARTAGDEAWIVYDGECPFCSGYVRLVRLREAIGTVHLVDARAGGPVVDDVVGQGFDLDEGMVLVWQGAYYHGADCMHMLAMLSSPSSRLNRLGGSLLRSKSRARFLYPFLRAGRNTVLRLLGRSKIGTEAV